MDDLEAKLQELARDTDSRLADRPIVPRPDVARRGRLRRLAFMAGSACLVVMLAVGGYAAAGAIGGGGTAPTESNVLVAAAERTRLEDTMRTALRMKMEITVDDVARTMSFRGSGEVSFIDNLAYLVMEATGDMQPTTTFETIQDGSTVYMKNENMAGWTKEESSTELGAFGGTGQMQPDELLDYLDSITGDIEVVGHEEIDGEPVTHYRAPVDVGSMTEDLNTVQKSYFDAYDPVFEPVETWVDSSGRIRKASFALAQGGEGERGSFAMDMSFTMWLFDFGEPVDIEIPDESEIVEDTGGDTLVEDMEGDVVHSEDIDDQEPEDDVDPIEPVLLLVGRDGFDGPTVLVFEDEGDPSSDVCFEDLPSWAETVGLYREASSAPLAVAEVQSEGEDFVFTCSNATVDSPKRLARQATDLVIRIGSGERSMSVPIVEAVDG